MDARAVVDGLRRLLRLPQSKALIRLDDAPVAQQQWDEGPAMQAHALIAVTAFLIACGVHPDDFGAAWAICRAAEFQADHPSDMGPLVWHLHEYAREREVERERVAAGHVGRHTGPIVTPPDV